MSVRSNLVNEPGKKILVRDSGMRVYEDRRTGIVMEMKYQPIWGRKNFAVTASQVISFFQGQTTANDIAAFVQTDGQLPNGMAMDAYGVCLALERGVSEADQIKFYDSAVASFKLSNKEKLKLPAMRIPTGGGFYGFASTTASATTIFHAANCVPGAGAYWPLSTYGLPLPISMQEHLKGEVETFAAANFSATFNAWYFVDGILGESVGG